MSHPNFIILYVSSPTTSAVFYERLLGQPPVEATPTFAMFALKSGVMLGLWARRAVEPLATGSAGAMEVAIAVDNTNAVTALHQAWKAQGLPIVQEPTAMDFGFTFVATDPDGHRLRVFAPGAV
jgi:predicted enzyme related to lactoylglutathione lyase